jgi:hypothetical protein
MKKLHVALLIALAMSFLFIGLVSAATSSPVITKESCGKIYTVTGGDNLTRIAYQCDTTVEILLSMNPDITNPDFLYPGQEIIMRLISPSPTPTPHYK